MEPGLEEHVLRKAREDTFKGVPTQGWLIRPLLDVNAGGDFGSLSLRRG